MEQIRCNRCGMELSKDYLSVRKEWGYFSNKDTEIHSFCICESCYDKMINEFKVPIQIEDLKELL